jgi:hypothetical protein
MYHLNAVQFWTISILAGVGGTAIFIVVASLTWLALVWKRANKKSHLTLLRSEMFQEAANRQIDNVLQEYEV